MVSARSFLVLFSFFISLAVNAQEKKYFIGQPIDIKQTGWNKVLCMRNGSTMLFHFEPDKSPTVIVFDSLHKQIADRKDKFKILDVLMSRTFVFKGLYDINGEAVLFLEQDIQNKNCLIRLRYNSTTGALIEEKMIGQSESENRRIQYYVMKNTDNDNYEILFCMDKRHPKESDIFIVYFNNKHESLKKLQLEVDRKKFDYLHVLGAESRPNGVLITLGLDVTTIYGKVDENTAMQAGGSTYEHYLSFYYLPKDSTSIKTSIIDLSAAVYPFYSLYARNSFAGSLNLLLFSYKPLFYQFGLNKITGRLNSSLFFKVDEQDMSVGFNRMQNNIANQFLRQQTDTTHFFDGIPVRMFTNENGLTTLVSQSNTQYGEPETKARYNVEDYFENIGITQFDDDGNEMWGITLPFIQYFKSYRHHYSIKEMAKRWQTQVIFGDDPPRVYMRQFVSINSYSLDKNFYIIYNDYDKNFNNTLRKPGDTVYNFDVTNACYYKISRKREITKNYLFGTPLKNEYKASFIEGADLDEQRGAYVTLIQYKKGDRTSICMAWAKLDQ